MNIQQLELQGSAALSKGLTQLNTQVLTDETKAELLATVSLTKKLVTTAYFLTFGSLTTAARFSFETGAKFRYTLQTSLEDLLVQLELIQIHPISVEELRLVAESIEQEDLTRASDKESEFVMSVLDTVEPYVDPREVAETAASGEVDYTKFADEWNNLPKPSAPEQEETPHSIATKSMLEVMGNYDDSDDGLLMEVNSEELTEEMSNLPVSNALDELVKQPQELGTGYDLEPAQDRPAELTTQDIEGAVNSLLGTLTLSVKSKPRRKK